MQCVEIFRNYLRMCLEKEQILEPCTVPDDTDNITTVIKRAIDWLQHRKCYKPYIIYSVWFAVRALIENNFIGPSSLNYKQMMSEHPDIFVKCFDEDFIITEDNIYGQYIRLCFIACKLCVDCEPIINYTPIDIPYDIAK